jgi:hypothetical protein
VTDAHGRTIAVWTLLSSTLCFLCAFNLQSKPLYAATFLSFVYAIGYLSVECVVYHTIREASLAPFTFIAGTTQFVSATAKLALIFNLVYFSCISMQWHPWPGCCFSGIRMVMAPVIVGLLLPSSPDPAAGLFIPCE